MIKKLIYILILIIINGSVTLAQTQSGQVEYGGYDYAFTPGDESKFLTAADRNLKMYEFSKIPSNRDFHLQEALRFYFLLSKAQPNSIEAQIGLGRVYDELNLDKYALKNLLTAYNFDTLNPKTNFYCGNYYYKRSDFVTALNFYKTAYQNGYDRNYALNIRLGNLYEKLADIETAGKYYKNALKLNKNDSDLKAKIHSLDDINYAESQYYLYENKK